MARALFRLPPKNPVHVMTTYSIINPAGTHSRQATCAESDCRNYRFGWKVRLDPLTPDLRAQIKRSGKKFTKSEISATETWLVFDAGQECFDGDAGRHRIPIDRPPLFVVRGGDWRGNPRGERRVHKDMAGWIEDMSTNHDKLMTRLARG